MAEPKRPAMGGGAHFGRIMRSGRTTFVLMAYSKHGPSGLSRPKLLHLFRTVCCASALPEAIKSSPHGWIAMAFGSLAPK